MPPRVLVIAAAAALVSLAATAADDPGKVDGTLQAAGRTIRLDHVLIVYSGNEEGLDDAPRLRVYLSDAPIPLQLAGGASTLRAQAWARNAKISAVVIRADPTGKDQGGVADVLAAPGLEPGMFASLARSDGFAPLRVAGGRASGVASFGNDSTVVKAKFDAPVITVPIAQDLKDSAAADSAPAKAWLAYMAGLRKGDFKEAARHATQVRMQQLEQFRTQAGEIFKNMAKQMPDGSALARQVRRVIVRGDLASVVLSTKEVNELVREGADWKVD
ncbi:MAG: hypothetical protein ABJA61_05340 [Caldimonas sp.]